MSFFKMMPLPQTLCIHPKLKSIIVQLVPIHSSVSSDGCCGSSILQCLIFYPPDPPGSLIFRDFSPTGPRSLVGLMKGFCFFKLHAYSFTVFQNNPLNWLQRKKIYCKFDCVCGIQSKFCYLLTDC